MVDDDLILAANLTRRDIMKYSAGTVASVYLGAFNIGCDSNTTPPQFLQWNISKDVYTTAECQILSVPVTAAAPKIAPKELPLYTQAVIATAGTPIA